MQLAEGSFLLTRDLLCCDHEEVAIAGKVTGFERERAHDVGADEIFPENQLHAVNEIPQQLVQLRKIGVSLC